MAAAKDRTVRKAAKPTGRTAANSGPDLEQRQRGRRPGDARDRHQQVEKAIAELESLSLPFTMRDVAQRAGISRATLYRDAGLRDLVGRRGDGPKTRPVDRRDFEALQKKADLLAEERRTLRRAVRALEVRVQAAELRADELSAQHRDAERARR
ncbi:MAG: TetR family transcriptional regulator, partial [Cytophagales bacterium]|nr:TetR family transcriptional regulator [Armatimonadota bacterium]